MGWIYRSKIYDYRVFKTFTDDILRFQFKEEQGIFKALKTVRKNISNLSDNQISVNNSVIHCQKTDDGFIFVFEINDWLVRGKYDGNGYDGVMVSKKIVSSFPCEKFIDIILNAKTIH